jgi:type III secretion system FlhB-like substrate exporter
MEKKRVVGVSCDPAESAPIVVLKGAGAAADVVLDAAREHDGPPVIRNAALVDQLYRVPIDSAVGRELFPVMAALLAHVLLADRKLQEATR